MPALKSETRETAVAIAYLAVAATHIMARSGIIPDSHAGVIHGVLYLALAALHLLM